MEELALESNAFFMGIEYLAVFCSGLMGGLCAVRKNYDLFAMLITAWLTALGGGIIRDVMLGSLPPVGISDRGFVLTALVSGLAIAVIHPEVDKLRWSMLTIDALAVGLFAVNGTSKARFGNLRHDGGVHGHVHRAGRRSGPGHAPERRADDHP